MNVAVTPTMPKRAVLLDLQELELVSRALADMAIDTWGGIRQNPAFTSARRKIEEALTLCIADKKGRP